MSKAIKCDRCGAYAEEFNREDFKFMLWECRQFFSSEKKLQVPLDLCQNCLSELEKWFDVNE